MRAKKADNDEEPEITITDPKFIVSAIRQCAIHACKRSTNAETADEPEKKLFRLEYDELGKLFAIRGAEKQCWNKASKAWVKVGEEMKMQKEKLRWNVKPVPRDILRFGERTGGS